MKNRNQSLKERGVVLLLVLGLMTMFAMLVLAFMIATSNMAETSVNIAKSVSVQNSVGEPQDESYQALRTLMTGTNNRLSPIAPFSILENLYGDYSRWVGNNTGNGSWYDNSFIARVELVTDVPSQSRYVRIYRMIQETDAIYGVAANKSDVWKSYSIDALFIETGSVLTFGECLNSNAVYVNLWRSSAASTSTIVSRKIIPNPDVYSDNIGNPLGGVLNTWYIEVPLTDSVRRFFADSNLTSIDNVMVRLNQPAYSGTGVGHFDPLGNLDGSSFRDGANFFTHWDDFRIPYMKWANAAAPDTIPYIETGSSLLSAQSFWAHLINGLYNPYQANAAGTGSQYVTFNANGWAALNPLVLGRNGVLGSSVGEAPQPVKMHPSYTAPDQRNLFLAWYNGTPQPSGSLDNMERFSVIPSFHRPDLIKWVLNQTITKGSGGGAANISIFGSGKALSGDTINTGTWSEIDALGALRKMTPRPLQLDHWRFSGSNSGQDLNLFLTNYGNRLGLTSNEINWMMQLSTGANVRQYTNMYARIYADLIGPNQFAQTWKANAQTYSFVPYDVDNDNDGVNEGIWIPSGLPIRISEDGTPYATMFSYTVLDMDGRINVNYAGNWDQLPHYYVSGAGQNGYDSVAGLVRSYSGLVNNNGSVNGVLPLSPFYDVEKFTRIKNNAFSLLPSATYDWVDDLGNTSLANGGDLIAMRGNGTGPSSVSLYHSLKYLGFDVIDTADSLSGRLGVSASNLLWRRYSARTNRVHYLPINSISSPGIDARSILRNNYEQPGSVYSATGTQLASAYERWMTGMTHPIFQLAYSANIQTMLDQYGATEPDVSKFIFPYRGKTRIMSYAPSPSLYPLFNFADTALRTYDPAGHQTYTYPPRFGENPYRFTAQYQTNTDSPYSWGMLEGLLRYGDSDSQKLSNTLVNDLINNYSGQLLSVSNYRNLFLAAKGAITTISSDIPASTVTFVDKEVGEPGGGFEGGGAYGIIPLIQKCVLAEFHAIFEQRIKDEVTAGTLTPAEEQTLRTDLDLLIQKVTTYLVTLLPPETLMGQKIDLNKLSQKSYWLDVKFKDDVFEPAGGVNGGWPMYVDFGTIPNGDVAKREIHNYGLVKRMEYARGIYLLLMALTYEDRHAGTVYPNAMYPDGTTAKNLQNYFEGAFNLDVSKLTNQEDKTELGRELIANRIAQWCMNLVDFSDPDATMTPLYYDSNPFDGWWASKTSYADVRGCPSSDRLTKTYVPLFASYEDTFGANVYTLSPNEAINRFFLDYYNAPDAVATGVSFTKVTDVDPFPNGETLSYANKIRFLLTAKTVDPSDASKTITQDRQFRLVWGMERPDLVLTETLNFHDLGIANTKIRDGDPANSNDSGDKKVATVNTLGFPSGGGDTGDNDYDQVSRPKGSTYLELVCTANPNVPQTSELYVYAPLKNSNDQFVDLMGNVVNNANKAAWSWQLRLTKKTPLSTDSAGRQIEFPVWRIAITDSRDPRGIAPANAQFFRKESNLVLKGITDHPSTFSFQPKQFRNLPVPTTTEIPAISDLNMYPTAPPDTLALLDWKDYNLNAASILGPYFTVKFAQGANDSEKRDNAERAEMQLDRVIWFFERDGDQENDGGKKLGTAGKYPDALRTFCRTKGATPVTHFDIAPNQYLVLGPELVRSIGSRSKNSTVNKEYDATGRLVNNNGVYKGGNRGCFGIPCLNHIDLQNLGGNAKYMTIISNIGSEPLSISMPLWTADDKSQDPFLLSSGGVGGALTNNNDIFYVRNKPFERVSATNPGGPTDVRRDIPISADQLFGLGIIPGYKSAFVQRVADPNRPYHPLANPYISVDWNVMDLTIFNGESIEQVAQEDSAQDENRNALFAENSPYKTTFSLGSWFTITRNQNLITIPNTDIFRGQELGIGSGGSGDNSHFPYYSGVYSSRDGITQTVPTFSSRQWGRFGRGYDDGDKVSQPAFAPEFLKDETRPNLFSRAFSFSEVAIGIDKKTNTGLEGPDIYTDNSGGGDSENAVFKKRPKHTLGFYNDLGKTGTVSYNGGTGVYTFSATTTGNNLKYSGMNPAYDEALMSPYHNAPAVLDGSAVVAAPFEHLVWNDAPLSNPAEIMLVPASAPGRFGIEFIRNPKGNPQAKTMTYDLTQLYRNGKPGDGTSLGTSAASGMAKGAMFGYDFEAYAKRTASGSGDEDEHNKMGAYLNFFNSSATAGGSLNLASLLDFVRVSSPVLGTRVARGDELLPLYTTRHLAGKDMVDTMREPGKININTMGQASWSGIVADGTGAKQSLYAQFVNVDSNRALLFFQNQTSGVLNHFVNTTLDHNVLLPMLNAASSSTTDTLRMFRPSNYSLIRRPLDLNTFTTDPAHLEADADGTTPGSGIASNPLFDSGGTNALRGDLYAATAELQRLSNLTTTRSNVFAAWITTAYFAVEPVNPGENMPKYDPDGNEITRALLANSKYKYYYYYKAIYPDGYTYGKELGLEDGQTKRHRSFFLIDRSVPVDFRRGQSLNWKDAVLLHRQIE